MKFSIITPTHVSTPYFYDLYKSIEAQTEKNWEWVIYLNGGALKVVDEIANNPKVKIYKDDWQPTWTQPLHKDIKIGNIKNKAFFKGKGDILVEADHDDLLTPNCLAELKKAFTKGIGFCYSDTAYIGLTKPLSADYGWQSYEYEHQGEKLIVMCAFEPSPKMIQSMWFSPNHVRAWRKDVYHKLGGHDKTLRVCDDLDLMIRTYSATKLKRISLPLYIYRIDGNNTFIKNAYEIQQTTRALQHKYREIL